MELLARVDRQIKAKKKRPIGNEEVKLSLFAVDIILCAAYNKKYTHTHRHTQTDTLLELVQYSYRT